ncbi:MAG: hypothetical protein V3V09_07370 [Arenicellales bacterium]
MIWRKKTGSFYVHNGKLQVVLHGFDSAVASVVLTGVKNAPQFEGVVFDVASNNGDTVKLDIASAGIAPPSVVSDTGGGAWAEYIAGSACDGAGRLMFNPVKLNTVNAGATIGDHSADNLSTKNRGLICKMNLNTTDYQNGDRRALITSTTDMLIGTNINPDPIKDAHLVNIAQKYTYDIPQGDNGSKCTFAFDKPVVLSAFTVVARLVSGWPSGTTEDIFQNANLRGKREFSTEWELIKSGINISHNADTRIVIDNNTAFKEYKLAEDNFNAQGGNENETHQHSFPCDIYGFTFENASGVLSASFAPKTLINTVVMPDISASKDTILQIEAVNNNGEDIDVYYPAITPTFSMGEMPHAGTSLDLPSDGYHAKEPTAHFIIYIPPVIADSITVTVHSAGAELHASMLLLYAYHLLSGAKNFNFGAQTKYADQDKIDLTADLVARTESRGTLISRTVDHQMSNDHDTAQISRAYINKNVCVLDSYPLAPSHKRARNLIVGRITSSTGITEQTTGGEFQTTITETKMRQENDS